MEIGNRDNKLTLGLFLRFWPEESCTEFHEAVQGFRGELAQQNYQPLPTTRGGRGTHRLEAANFQIIGRTRIASQAGGESYSQWVLIGVGNQKLSRLGERGK